MPGMIFETDGLAGTPEGRAPAGNAGQPARILTKVVVLLIASLAFAIVVIAAKPAINDWAADLMTGNAPAARRVALTGIGLLLLVTALAVGFSAKQTDTRRAGIIIVMGVPAATLVFIGLATPSDSSAMSFVRSAFVATAIVFPAALFFLFVATRRAALLNAYLANLDRLGVLGRRALDDSGRIALYVAPDRTAGYEPEASRVHRVRSYLDRFAAAFGKLPELYVDRIIEQTRLPPQRRTSPPHFPLSSTEFELKTILPVLIYSILATIGWITILPAFTTEIHSPGPQSRDWFDPSNIAPTSYAFLGAYFFSLQMLVRRYMRRDLGPNAYVGASSRIVISVVLAWLLVLVWEILYHSEGQPLAYVLPSRFDATPDRIIQIPAVNAAGGLPGAILPGAIGLRATSWVNVLAFTVGIFPYVLWQWVMNILNAASIRFLPKLPNPRRGVPLAELDGLTIWHEARLEEEDIENAANMADADIVDLMLNTKICPHRIIEWVDQAILLRFIVSEADLALAEREVTLRDMLKGTGIRTSTALVTAMEGRNFQPSLPQGMDPESLKLLVAAMKIYPNFSSVMRWKGLGGKIELEAPGQGGQTAG